MTSWVLRPWVRDVERAARAEHLAQADSSSTSSCLSTRLNARTTDAPVSNLGRKLRRRANMAHKRVKGQSRCLSSFTLLATCGCGPSGKQSPTGVASQDSSASGGGALGGARGFAPISRRRWSRYRPFTLSSPMVSVVSAHPLQSAPPVP